MKNTQTVYVVDDDEAMRDSLSFMLRAASLVVATYSTAQAFLDSVAHRDSGCVLLDLRMPHMTGDQLHDQLNARGVEIPVIYLTGHGDVPTAVERMKAGAFDFLIKPVNRKVLLSRVRAALIAAEQRRTEADEITEIKLRLAKLSPRELQVMDQIALGEASKSIANAFGLSYKTVTHHRDHLLKKMEASNTADLVRMLGLVGRISRASTGKSA